MNILIAFIIVFLTVPAWAIDDDAGTTGSSFLKNAVGARTLSLADTCTAVADEWSDFFSNPAATAVYADPAVSASASQWIADTRYGSLTYIHPVKIKKIISRKVRKKKIVVKNITRSLILDEKSLIPSRSKEIAEERIPFVVGIGILYFDGGTMDKTGIDAYDLAVPLGTQVKASGQALMVNLSKKIGRYLFGINAKHITQTLGDYRASAYAADAGMVYHLCGVPEAFMWDAGLAYHNAGTELDFRDETPHTDPLPASIRLGNLIQKNKYKLSFDLIMPVDNTLRGNAGFEYQILEGAAFRFGFKAFGYDKLSDDYFSTMRMGLGIPFKVLRGNLDYAFVPMGDFGYSHHISVTFFMAPPKPKDEDSGWYNDKF